MQENEVFLEFTQQLLRIDSTEAPFLVNTTISSGSPGSQKSPKNSPPRETPKLDTERFISTSLPSQNEIPLIPAIPLHISRSYQKTQKPRGKYDHVPSKVREYRMQIRNQTSKTNEDASADNPSSEIPVNSDEDPEKVIEYLRKLVEDLRGVIAAKDSIIESKEDEMIELTGKHNEEVAVLKMSLDSFRYELTRLKGTTDISQPYKQTGINISTPLKALGNILKTPIRSFSNVLLKTPSKRVSSTSSITPNEKVQLTSFVSNDGSENDYSYNESSQCMTPFLASISNKNHNSNISESPNKISDPNLTTFKTSTEPILKKSDDNKRRTSLGNGVSNMFSKIVDYSQRFFSSTVSKTGSKANLNLNKNSTDNVNPSILTGGPLSSPKTDTIRRRVSFSNNYTETSLPRINIESITDSPKSNLYHLNKIKNTKRNKHSTNRNIKFNCFRLKNESISDEIIEKAPKEDREIIIMHHIDETIRRLEELKEIMK